MRLNKESFRKQFFVIHKRGECTEWKFGDVGTERFEHNRERAELKRNHARRHRQPRTRLEPARNRQEYERIRHKTRKKRHIEDVAAQRQNAAVGEKERLNNKHAREHDKGWIEQTTTANTS